MLLLKNIFYLKLEVWTNILEKSNLSKTVIVRNYYFLSGTGSLNKLIEIIRTLPVDQER